MLLRKSRILLYTSFWLNKKLFVHKDKERRGFYVAWKRSISIAILGQRSLHIIAYKFPEPGFAVHSMCSMWLTDNIILEMQVLPLYNSAIFQS